MKKYYIIIAALFSIFISCGSDDENYTVPDPDPVVPVSPVVVDLNAVPYPVLSSYKFFEGDMKNLQPAYKVIPYDLNSGLFTDYASKKRFVWMPDGAQATYTSDSDQLNFPTGAVLIKNFYYDNIQPGNTTRIIETRLMIKKTDGWIFANYVWNNAQTEATLDPNGSYTDVAFNHEGTTINTSYRIPAEFECATCHKVGQNNVSIGMKPQNLNKNFNYNGTSKNQLTKWIEEGYLKSEGVPSEIVSTVDWTDTSKPLELRVRSYLDINCAHCHAAGTHCDYTPMRLAFHETVNPVNLGICVTPLNATVEQPFIVAKRQPNKSALHQRMNTTESSEMMPMLGRTVIHAEGVQLMREWISSMDGACQ
ncbi:MAG: hypothetical protein EOO45_13985 [Flavobacterium sp.]|nr:MAG: hypothetical protein EOO45_13985 [Flavobacterium sp.]